MMDDMYAPISKRLRAMTKDLSNAVSSILSVSAAAPKIRQQRGEVDAELKEAINHLSRAFHNWQQLGEVLDYIDTHLSELDEMTLAQLVEKSADSTQALEWVGIHGRMKEVRTAHAMMSLDNDLIPYSVKEVGTHDIKKLNIWYDEIDKFFKEKNYF